MFILTEDGKYIALENGPPGRVLLEQPFPNGYLDVTGAQKVSSPSIEGTSDSHLLGVSNDSLQTTESYE
jgi:hypothetical protein